MPGADRTPRQCVYCHDLDKVTCNSMMKQKPNYRLHIIYTRNVPYNQSKGKKHTQHPQGVPQNPQIHRNSHTHPIHRIKTKITCPNMHGKNHKPTVYHFLPSHLLASPPVLCAAYRFSTNNTCIARYASTTKLAANIPRPLTSCQNARLSKPNVLRIVAPGTSMSSPNLLQFR